LKTKVRSTICYLCIGYKENPTNVIQMHISKHSYIKPYIDMNDLESLIITWFTEGHLKGIKFGLFQIIYKFSFVARAAGRAQRTCYYQPTNLVNIVPQMLYQPST